VTRRDGDEIEIWSARDALVLKALALVLADHLPVARSCTHVRGHGGAKAAVRAVWRHVPAHRFVLRTDVKSYYASIDHHRLFDQLAEVIKDRSVLSLLWLYLRRTVEHGGLFCDHRQGISRGCALSPLIGAFFLRRLDERMSRLGLFYVRFMDDILVLAPTRWKLRKAVAVVNRGLDALGLAKHPDKTFIGRIEKGFDFLGYHFAGSRWGPEGLTVAKATVSKFVERATRLYEQGPGEPEGSHRLGEYVRRWTQWVGGGLRAGITHLPSGSLRDDATGSQGPRQPPGSSMKTSGLASAKSAA
jgi:RNA-directed DNA polymerase